jgi:hypothetical protein
LHGYQKIDLKRICDKRSIKKVNSLLSNEEDNNEFKILEVNLIGSFMRDMYVGVCYHISNSYKINKYSNTISLSDDNELKDEDFKEINTSIITHKNLNFKDDSLNKGEYMNICFSEYAPKAFRQIRAIEHIKEIDLIK